MTRNFDNEKIVVGNAKPFTVQYQFRRVAPSDTRNAYLGLITDVAVSVQAKLGFPDFSLYSGLLHTVRSFAVKNWLAPSTLVKVNGVGVYVNDLGGSVSFTDK